MRRTIELLTLLSIGASLLLAQCPQGAKRVYVIVVNGIATTPERAGDNSDAVRIEIDTAAERGLLNTPRDCISELPLYNPTIDVAVDLVESASSLSLTDSLV